MPHLIDYPAVLERLSVDRWVCLYPRSGAFGLPADAASTSLGWIGAADPSLRPEAQRLARMIEPPVVDRMVGLFVEAWQRLLPGELWLMPKSHWAYELQFGNAGWLPDSLQAIGIDAEALIDRADGTAIAFGPTEQASVVIFLTALLTRLTGSDFQAAFPGRSTICTVHSHQQLWWTSAGPGVIDTLEALRLVNEEK